MRILIIEDDQGMRESLKSALEGSGYCVDATHSGDKGSYLARTNDYDIVLLDYVLPGKLGNQVCQEIRDSGKTMPIIILSVQGEVPAKIELLNMGADDYVTKPFSLEELLARIRAVLRRPRALQGDILSVDDLTIDTVRYRVMRAGQEISLTRKEFGLLEYLTRNKGNVLSRGMIMEHVWDIHGDLFSNTIETHILNLRKKINLPGRKKLIQTVSGRGYKIEATN